MTFSLKIQVRSLTTIVGPYKSLRPSPLYPLCSDHPSGTPLASSLPVQSHLITSMFFSSISPLQTSHNLAFIALSRKVTLIMASWEKVIGF